MASAFANAATIFSTSAIVTFSTDGTYTLTMNKFDNTVTGCNGCVLTGVGLFLYGAEDLSTLTLSNAAGASSGSYTGPASGQQTFDAFAASNIVFGATNTANSADVYAGQVLDLFDTGLGATVGLVGAPIPSPTGSITLGGNNGGANPVACAPGTPNANCTIVAYTPPDDIVSNIDAIYGFNVQTGAGGVTGVFKNVTPHIASYIGTGTFSIGGSTKSITTFSGGGNNISFGINDSATFQAEVDYTYFIPSGTPEPATILLMGGALVGVGLLRKRIKA